MIHIHKYDKEIKSATATYNSLFNIREEDIIIEYKKCSICGKEKAKAYSCRGTILNMSSKYLIYIKDKI